GQQGYQTACIGKWHLGMDWALNPGAQPFNDSIEKGEEGWRVDYTKPIANGPNSIGFEYFFGIAASLDMAPYSFIENDRITEIPTEDRAFPMMWGRTNSMTRRGPAAKGFEAENVLPVLTQKAIDYLRQRATAAKQGKPFFLYLAFNAPHTPIAPTKEWQGKSGLNPYADFVMETDACAGKVLETLEELGLARDTLVMFASDNGCSPEAKFNELLEQGHNPSGLSRGMKADIFDGGHHVPFLVRWPGHVKKGTTSSQLVCLNDIFATCAEILGHTLPENAAEDSVSLLPALEKGEKKPLREALVHHSINGSFAIRQGNWKLELCADSGGWSTPVPGSAMAKTLPPVQLYDLARDIGETNNVYLEHPDVVARLRTLLVSYAVNGRSTPGAPQTNTSPVIIPQQSTARRESKKAPNVLFVIADQWRAQAFGFAGDPNVRTPNLDRFERQAVNFTQAVAGMPVCSPTRASLLTGQRPQTHGVFINDVPLSSEAMTLPKILKAAGYDTGCIGKWHVDGHGSRSAFIPPERRQGFEYWKVLECTHAYSNSFYYADGPEKLKWSGYDAIAQTRDAQAYLRERSKANKPFLLWLAWGPPHNPYETAPARYRSLYEADKMRLQPNVPEKAREQARKELAGYYAHCTALDDCFADLLRTLEETGLATNTIVVFTSDHGDMLWSHDEQRKQRPWEESARVPLLIRLPESLHILPRRIAATINSEDMMPTLLRLCGETIPKSVEGFDFSDSMRGEKDPSGGATVIRCISPFGEFTRKRGGREYRELRTEQYTYVRSLDGPWLLYDNVTDPYQLTNLVGKTESHGLQERLESLLQKKLIEQRDEFRPGPEYIKKWGYKVDSDETAVFSP
ncbi:MAG: Arylsulfatase, partial [Verrucomicrobiales bacterium]|nr:Arylsulfatase [Verrucomicrobiales bacterium]